MINPIHDRQMHPSESIHELHPSPSQMTKREWWSREVLPRPYFLLKVYLHCDKGDKVLALSSTLCISSLDSACGRFGAGCHVTASPAYHVVRPVRLRFPEIVGQLGSNACIASRKNALRDRVGELARSQSLPLLAGRAASLALRIWRTGRFSLVRVDQSFGIFK